MAFKRIDSNLKISLPPFNLPDEKENRAAATLIEKASGYFESNLLTLPGRKKGSPLFSNKLIKRAKEGGVFVYSLKRELLDFLAIHEKEGVDLLRHLKTAIDKKKIILTKKEKNLLEKIEKNLNEKTFEIASLQVLSIDFRKEKPLVRCALKGRKKEEVLIYLPNLCMLQQEDVASWRRGHKIYRLFAGSQISQGVRRRFEHHLRHLIIEKIKILKPGKGSLILSKAAKKIELLMQSYTLLEGRKRVFSSLNDTGSRYITAQLNAEVGFEVKGEKGWALKRAFHLESGSYLQRQGLKLAEKVHTKTYKIHQKRRYLILSLIGAIFLSGGAFLSRSSAQALTVFFNKLRVDLLKEGSESLVKGTSFLQSRMKEAAWLICFLAGGILIANYTLPKVIASLERKVYRLK